MEPTFINPLLRILSSTERILLKIERLLDLGLKHIEADQANRKPPTEEEQLAAKFMDRIKPKK